MGPFGAKSRVDEVLDVRWRGGEEGPGDFGAVDSVRFGMFVGILVVENDGQAANDRAVDRKHGISGRRRNRSRNRDRSQSQGQTENCRQARD